MKLLAILCLIGRISTHAVRGGWNVPSIQSMREASWYASAVACTDRYVMNWSCAMCQKVPSARHVESFSNKVQNTRAFVAIDTTKHRIIVAFRGSKNVQNVLADGFFVLVPFSPVKRLNAKVHGGFKIATLSIYDGILHRLRILLKEPEYAGYRILMTGHSLGGSMAVLSTIQLQEDLQLPWHQFEVITLGQPPTGNLEFVEWYNSQHISTARVVNHFDLIPHLGSSYLGLLAHHLREVWITGPGNATNIKICKPELVDLACSASLSPALYRSDDHLHYFDAGFGKEDCSPNTAPDFTRE